MNIIKEYTAKEAKAIKNFWKLEDFYFDKLGAYVFTFDEGCDTWGYGFLVRIEDFKKATRTRKTQWILDTLTDDVYILYKTAR